MGLEIAVLSYHGWEIDPENLLRDIKVMREKGWQEASLEDLEHLLSGRRKKFGQFFHITSDDGGEGDYEFVAALRLLSCPATLFISLAAMTEKARAIYQEMLHFSDLSIQDHSFRHKRIFHYRSVIGFHSDAKPLASSPERHAIAEGSPVCIYGGELARTQFTPDERAIDICQDAARSCIELPGTPAWEESIAHRLLASGFGFRRLGKLCIQGEYETREEFKRRISTYLVEGKRALGQFTNRPPMAFAYPWWEMNALADRCLGNLGYKMTFAGRGLCRKKTPFRIPRIFVNNQTPRPLNLKALDVVNKRISFMNCLGDLGRHMVFR